MTDKTYYRLRLLNIDAWRGLDGGWFWNNWYEIEDGIYLREDRLTPRKLLAFMRRAGWLTEKSKGRVYLDDLPTDRVHITVCDRYTHEPLLCLEQTGD